MKKFIVILSAIISVIVLIASTQTVSQAAEVPSTPPSTPATTKAATTTTAPAEIRRGVAMSGDPETRAKQVYERLLRNVEPSLQGNPARLPLYLDIFRREFIEDTRTFAFNVMGEFDHARRVILTGYVEFPEHQKSLADLFKYLGMTIEDQTELLPSKNLGDLQFGVITSPSAFIYDKPTGKRETFTECMQGDSIFILKDAGNGQLLCHAPDGYVGYIAASAIRRVDGKEFDQIEATRAGRRPTEIEQIVAAAMKLIGTKYVWGGGTKDGVDCSGLVRAGFRSIDITLPRDADQQSLVGRLVATRWHRSSMKRGDTLYFLGRRGTINHTAIYLGDHKFIEATEPVVKISSFDPADANYSEKRDKSFCFAKRILE